MKGKNNKQFIIIVSILFLLTIVFLYLARGKILQTKSTKKLQMINTYSQGDHPVPKLNEKP
ncbi:MAG: hypothetical protein HYT08_03600 [Candidatus Levybacteria bacterium]|nr:hypothetical protein [Candidatus Levybacteria bacterium]